MSPSPQTGPEGLLEDEVGALIASAGRRPEVDARVRATVFAAVEQAWQEQGAQRRRRRGLKRLLAASLAGMALLLGWRDFRQDPAVAGPVGVFVAARGPVQVAPLGARGLIVAGDALEAGTSISTGGTGEVLVNLGSVALRIGPATTVVLDSDGQVRLDRGRVYVDSGGPADHAQRVVVDTPLGRVTHLGTEFQVRLDPSRLLSVSVREGSVVILDGAGRGQRITRGQGVDVAAGGAVTRLAVSPTDASWEWVGRLLPDFAIDGRPLSAFLDWYAREEGLRLVLVPPLSRPQVERTILSGSISGLTPRQALDAVMATTRFDYDTSTPGELRIQLRKRVTQGT
ncbi:MAG: FecR domain-containing protein [Gammaproteobacteria bacterium]|nr:FecR domain-containing protein [Gammaproteobacteria bacterium]